MISTEQALGEPPARRFAGTSTAIFSSRGQSSRPEQTVIVNLGPVAAPPSALPGPAPTARPFGVVDAAESTQWELQLLRARDQRPLRRAQVRLEDFTTHQEQRTSDDGLLRIRTELGRVQLRVRSAGYEPRWLEVFAATPGRRTLTVYLQVATL
jgi:hypothetical protein